MKRQYQLLKGFTDTIPLGISVAIYGVADGVLGGKRGFRFGEVLALSTMVFAGASQMIAVHDSSGGRPFVHYHDRLYC